MFDMSERRELNLIFSKSGSGSSTTKLSIPISWCHRMNIIEDDKSVFAYYNDKTKEIVISKK